MKLFPAGVRVEIAAVANQSLIYDLQTGENIANVKGIKVEVDASTGLSELTITVCGLDIEAASKDTIWHLDEDALRRLAEDNGFILTPKA